MSSGRRCLIRDLGLVKGGKGLRHHEVVLELTWRGLFRFMVSNRRTESAPAIRVVCRLVSALSRLNDRIHVQ
jgi:hypothetical protein